MQRTPVEGISISRESLEVQRTSGHFVRVLHHSLVNTIRAFITIYLLRSTAGDIKLVYRN